MSRGPDQLRLSPDERANLVAYVDGELPEAVSRAMATKLTQSATARREVEMLNRTWELLGHLELPQARPALSERTLTGVRQLEVRTPLWDSRLASWSSQAAWLIASLMLGAAALGFGYAATRSLWPDPSARLARELSIAENLNEYLEVGSFDFLKQLAESREFGMNGP
jgi:anti-sigma factor RsiW